MTFEINTIEKVDDVERFMLKFPQVPCPVRHIFEPGVYIREVTLPSNTWAIGHHQNFEHLNVMVKGKVKIYLDDGTTKILEAPLTYIGQPGRKVGYVIEETVWRNVYFTSEKDVEVLESYYLTKSLACQEHDPRLILGTNLSNEISKKDYFALLSELSVTEEEVREQVEDLADHVDLPDGEYKFQLGKSGIEGNGIFAVGNYAAEEIIGPGRLDGKRTILGRRLNHSCWPNAIAIPRGKDIYFYASRDIKGNDGGQLGDEITIDYRFTIAKDKGLERLLCRE